MANTILKLVGKKNSVLTMAITGYVTGIPVFCDSGFVILSPISTSPGQPEQCIPGRHGYRPVRRLICNPLSGSPYPWPYCMAGTLEADLGLTILVGLLVSIPATLSALFYAKKVSGKIDIPAN